MSPFLRTPRRFFSFALQTATLLLLPSLLHAATYYVRQGGSDSNSGLSSSAAWATIGKANATVRPGDVVLVADGTYAHFPNPAVPGTSGARITYLGNIANPAAVVISTGGSLTDSDLTVRGFRINGNAQVSGLRDSLADCHAYGAMSGMFACNQSVIARSRFVGARFWAIGVDTENGKGTVFGNTITDCSMELSPADAGPHTMRFMAMQGLTFRRNRIKIDIQPTARGAAATKMMIVRHSTFIDNSWDVTNRITSDPDGAGWFSLRDSTSFNNFVRDTIVMKGPGQVQFLGSSSGTYVGTVRDNRFDQCIIKTVGPSAFGAAMFFQDRAQQDTVTNCTIVGIEGGLAFNASMEGPMLIQGNTCVAFRPSFGPLDIDVTNPWTGTTVIRNNICYTAPGAARGTWRSSAIVTNGPNTTGHLVGNWNVFFTPMGRDSAAYAWPNSPSRIGVGGSWCNTVRADSNSTYGSPRFADSSSVLTFDARLLPGSAAIGAGLGGINAGAAGVVGADDTTPPAAITNLSANTVRDRSVTLSWTTTGDDGIVGQANRTELRWSTAPISEASFATANDASPTTTPLPPGSTETATIAGLTGSTTYYFAVVVIDEAGRRSPVSNVLTVTTLADQTPPALIGDLSAR